MNRFDRFANSLSSGLLLNLLLPGAGHIYFREYTFGVFIFLVWLIAVVLFYVSFLISLSPILKLLLFGLPLIFYFFTFIDLSNTLRKKPGLTGKGLKSALIIYLAAILYQFLSPTAPANFWVNNGPDIFILEDNRLSPLYAKGTVMQSNPLEYKIKIVGFGDPVLYGLPERYDIVRCKISDDKEINGVIIGLPGEEIEVIEGTVIINGQPDFEGWIGGLTLSGKTELTSVDRYSALIAILNFGALDRVIEVPLSDIQGKVSKLFE